jgi:hypothetical protein
MTDSLRTLAEVAASVSITLDTHSHAIPAMEETAASLVAALLLQE